jgi:dihydroorotate dehydrogenase
MTEFAGYDIELPFGPAAGVLNGVNEEKLIEQTIDCLRSPAGLVWMGSFTLNPSLGNEPVYGQVYSHDQTTGKTINHMGLPNIGFDRARKIYGELKKVADEYGKPLIPSVSLGRSELAPEVLPQMVEGFAEAGATIVEVNYSCPNLGGKDWHQILGYDVRKMQDADKAITDRVGEDVIISRKLPPYGENLIDTGNNAAYVFKKAPGVKILNLSNTKPSRVAYYELVESESGKDKYKDFMNQINGLAGESGPALAKVGLAQLAQFKRVVSYESNIHLMSCLGVMSGQDVLERQQLGALASSAVTLYIENETKGISYGETGVRMAEQYLEAQESVEVGKAEGEVEIGGSE